LRIEDGTFRLSDYRRFLADNAADIGQFKGRQQPAFEEERERWLAAGIADPADTQEAPAPEDTQALDGEPVAAPVAGGVWSVQVEPGDEVAEGQTLIVVESMKMEVSVQAPRAGRVRRVLCRQGQLVTSGQVLALME
jgi:urea carboxylase